MNRLIYAIELYRSTCPEQLTPEQNLLAQIAESCVRQEKLLQTAVASRALESQLLASHVAAPTKKVSKRRLRDG